MSMESFYFHTENNWPIIDQHERWSSLIASFACQRIGQHLSIIISIITASSQHPLSVRVASDAFRWSKKRSLVVDGRVLGLSRKKEKANLWIKLAMFYLPLWLEMEHKLFDILTLKQLSNLDSFHSSLVPPTNCNLKLSYFFLMVSFFRAWFL